MRYKFYVLLVTLFMAAVFLIISCSDSTGPNDPYVFPGPIDSVAIDITLTVYSVNKGNIRDTIELSTEGPVLINFGDDDPGQQYYIYAMAEDFYTELYYCQNGGSITVDLDSIPNPPRSITGVIFETVIFDPQYFESGAIEITGPGGLLISTTTDEQGRFGFGYLPEGEYTLSLGCFEMQFSFELVNTSATDYEDLLFNVPMIDRAPYLYLYPENEKDITVKLNFPLGGHVTISEPAYNDGWNVNVTPEGIINGEYGYLFYEVLLTVTLNNQTGWLLDGSNLENELRNLLSDLGFIGKEIDDFVEYWVPRLEDSPWYAVYPQNAESMITLEISPRPDNILRALFLIRPLAYQVSIPAPPAYETFTRNGFTVVEWGVIGAVE